MTAECIPWYVARETVMDTGMTLVLLVDVVNEGSLLEAKGTVDVGDEAADKS
jgi:hypothetical protein